MSETESKFSLNVHDNLKSFTVEELRGIADSDRLNFSICLINTEHDINIGNCIRTAHIMGARNVFIFGRRKIDSRSCVGAQNYTNVIKVSYDNMDDPEATEFAFDSMIKMYSLLPLFIDKTDKSISINKFNMITGSSDGDIAWRTTYKNIMGDGKHYCLIFGNEANGIPEVLLNKQYPHFHINQRGVVRSLNLASAASIAMYALVEETYNLPNGWKQ